MGRTRQKIVRGIFRNCRGAVIREWRILHKTVPSTLYFLCQIFKVIKYKQFKLARYVT